MDGSEQILAVLMPLLSQVWEHTKPVEFAQGLLQAGIIWHLVKKSMAKELQLFRDEISQIRKTITDGFSAGDKQFNNHENRIVKLESITNP